MGVIDCTMDLAGDEITTKREIENAATADKLSDLSPKRLIFLRRAKKTTKSKRKTNTGDKKDTSPTSKIVAI